MTSPLSRFRQNVQNTVNQYRQTAQTVLRGVTAGNGARGQVTDALAMRRALSGAPVTAPGNGVFDRLGRGVSEFMHSNGRALDFARRLGGGVSVLTGGLGAVRGGSNAVRSLGDAFEAARGGNFRAAAGHVGSAASSALEGTRSALTAARGALTIHNVGVARRGATAAVEAFRAAGGFQGLTSAAARTLEAGVAAGGSRIATDAARRGVAATARIADAGITVGTQAVTRAAMHAGTEVAGRVAVEAGEAALRAGTRAGASTLGRAAARFAPGVNIAMAVVDTGLAARDTYRAIQDPSARNIGRAVFSGLTAAGSIAAATNIPVVSQIGAGVSLVTGFVGSLF
ncbi:MAG: hypothetical protein SFW67_31670 [Myxococcaceae bacterium]|nr:hypothetical protein [Myxococcaceae bacterium]